ncbi:hypothetical protein BDW62DRAFT_209964 [Aspergillus aurantiobrunneus]
MDGRTDTVPSRQSLRLFSACEKCRVLKVKCVRDAEGQPCIKCAKSQSLCTIPDPKPRIRQARPKPRLAELDSKLTHLLGLLSQPNPPTNVDENSSNRSSAPPATTDHVEIEPGPNQSSAEWIGRAPLMDLDLNLIDTMGSAGYLDKAWTTPTSMDDAWITDLGLSSVVLQHLLNSFRSMDTYFPFVLIPAGWTAASMAEDRPFLLLAAVTSASSRYYNLQQVLIKVWRGILSDRVIMAAERDLDLLQGILVHIAWFHFQMDPRSPQTYQYLQMAISMVIDLGLDQQAADVLDQQPRLGQLHSREARRAYLGCFYLSSIISMSTAKPNNLPFSEHVLPCAMTLQHDQEYPTDKLIYSVIRLQQLTEEASETYRLGHLQTQEFRPHTHAERLKTRLEEWWSTVSSDIRGTVLLTSAYHAANIRILEMGYAYRYGQKRPPSRILGDSTLLAPSKVILNLTRCANSAKELLDFFIAIPTDEYSKLPLAVWYQFTLAIMVLYRLSTGLSDVPDWDRDIAQEIANLEEYCSVLRRHLQSIGTEPELETQSPVSSFFTMIPEILESVRASYISAREYSAHSHGAKSGHQSFSGDAKSRMPASSARGPYRCPGMRNLRQQTATSSTANGSMHSAIAADIAKIENMESETLWGDLLLHVLEIHSAGFVTSQMPYSGKTWVDILFLAASYLCGSTLNSPSASRGS